MSITKAFFTTISLALVVLLSLPANAKDCTIITYADGRPDGGIRQSAENEDGLDSPGDIFVFDQQLLAADKETVIGRNAGFCIRTDPGEPYFTSTDHPTLADNPNNNYGQCSWTLSFFENSGYHGSIQVSGREADLGTSQIAIVGGTGTFTGAMGVLLNTPIPQDEGGVLFRQELKFSRSRYGCGKR